MGNSLAQESCVSLEEKPVITGPSYTVLRTSGLRDEGWVISRPIPQAFTPKWIDQHAIKTDGVWRIFMHNNMTDPNHFACGWRRIETIHPTKLISEEDILNWRKCLYEILEELDARRLDKETLP
jgi:hypothetical protein